MSLLFSTGAFASSLSGAAPGMVLLTPSSITHSGTSASIGANGQVTFSAVTSLSLNGVFSADFDNYVVSIQSATSTVAAHNIRLRASGSDNSTASSYVTQNLQADSTSVSAGRVARNYYDFIVAYATQRTGSYVTLYGPYLAQPTAGRAVNVSDYLSGFIYETAFTHNQSTSYDGFTVYPGAGNMTGALQVYGVRS